MARLVFLGSPAAAVPTLRALVEAGHDVALVVSRGDARRGRGPATGPSPVKQAALELGLEVTDDLVALATVGAELGVVVAYGRIIPASLLEALPMVNLHFSLLPRWRGAAPVERAILAGDQETGVCLMRLEAGLDSGPVIDVRQLAIGDAHAGDLLARLADVGAAMLVDNLAGGVEALGPGRAQQGQPTYAEKLTVEELRLKWSRPAPELLRVVRLDRAWTTWRGKRLLVLDAEVAAVHAPGAADDAPGSLSGTVVRCGNSALELLVVQPEGKRPMTASQWVQGARPAVGELLGDPTPPR